MKQSETAKIWEIIHDMDERVAHVEKHLRKAQPQPKQDLLTSLKGQDVAVTLITGKARKQGSLLDIDMYNVLLDTEHGPMLIPKHSILHVTDPAFDKDVPEEDEE